MAKIILVTGAAGFLGSHTVEALARRGDRVIGLDSLDDYYPPELKRQNLAELNGPATSGRFRFVEGDIRDQKIVEGLFAQYAFDAVVHLAALAGVRASMDNAELYFDVNLNGTLRLLEQCCAHKVSQFVFASTSSVYGNTERVPFTEDDHCDRPLAPYPASKRCAELLGYSYHNIHGINFTALRFFTVYGPRNRPDMMAFKLLESITRAVKVPLYGEGKMLRDWTFVEDIVAGIVLAVDRPLGYRIINLGRGEPVLLSDFISLLEQQVGGSASLEPRPTPAADVIQTHADITRARSELGYAPRTSVSQGVQALWAWYQQR